MSKKLFVLIGFLLMFLLVGCGGGIDMSSTKYVVPQDLGEGIYYFACTGDCFSLSLAQFKRDHRDVVITAVSGDGNGLYGHNRGYFVVTYPREFFFGE